MQEARSKKRKAKASSPLVRVVPQFSGNFPVRPFGPSISVMPASRWTARPHCLSAGRPAAVLTVRIRGYSAMPSPGKGALLGDDAQARPAGAITDRTLSATPMAAISPSVTAGSTTFIPIHREGLLGIGAMGGQGAVSPEGVAVYLPEHHPILVHNFGDPDRLPHFCEIYRHNFSPFGELVSA